jgi:hypothetical protein
VVSQVDHPASTIGAGRDGEAGLSNRLPPAHTGRLSCPARVCAGRLVGQRFRVAVTDLIAMLVFAELVAAAVHRTRTHTVAAQIASIWSRFPSAADSANTPSSVSIPGRQYPYLSR